MVCKALNTRLQKQLKQSFRDLNPWPIVTAARYKVCDIGCLPRNRETCIYLGFFFCVCHSHLDKKKILTSHIFTVANKNERMWKGRKVTGNEEHCHKPATYYTNVHNGVGGGVWAVRVVNMVPVGFRWGEQSFNCHTLEGDSKVQKLWF